MDVRVERNVAAVLQRAGGSAGRDVLDEFALAFDEIGEVADRGRRRKNGDGAVGAVEKQRLPGNRTMGDVPEARDGGMPIRAGEEGDVARRHPPLVANRGQGPRQRTSRRASGRPQRQMGDLSSVVGFREAVRP